MKLRHNGPQHQPGNESPEHYLLKQYAVYFLLQLGCSVVAQEVWGLRSSNSKKVVVDALGIRGGVFSGGGRWRSYGVEAKVTRADYQSGFCDGVDYMYVMTPKGLLSRDDWVPKIGYVEVDVNHLRVEVSEWGSLVNLYGYEITRRPTRRSGDDMRRHKRSYAQLERLISRAIFKQLKYGRPLADLPVYQVEQADTRSQEAPQSSPSRTK